MLGHRLLRSPNITPTLVQLLDSVCVSRTYRAPWWCFLSSCRLSDIQSHLVGLSCMALDGCQHKTDRSACDQSGVQENQQSKSGGWDLWIEVIPCGQLWSHCQCMVTSGAFPSLILCYKPQLYLLPATASRRLMQGNLSWLLRSYSFSNRRFSVFRSLDIPETTVLDSNEAWIFCGISLITTGVLSALDK